MGGGIGPSLLCAAGACAHCHSWVWWGACRCSCVGSCGHLCVIMGTHHCGHWSACWGVLGCSSLSVCRQLWFFEHHHGQLWLFEHHYEHLSLWALSHFSHPFLGTYEVVQFFDLGYLKGTHSRGWYTAPYPFHGILG